MTLVNFGNGANMC